MPVLNPARENAVANDWPGTLSTPQNPYPELVAICAAEQLWQSLKAGIQVTSFGGGRGGSIEPSGGMESKPQGFPGQPNELLQSGQWLQSSHRVLEENHCYQPDDWSCGSAVFKMIAKTLAGEEVDYATAIVITGANEEVGTDNALMERALRDYFQARNFEVRTGLLGTEKPENGPQTACTLEQRTALLSELLREGYLVVINYREPEEQVGHFAVVQGISDKALEICDPWHGPRCVLELEQFDGRSGFSDPVVCGWFTAIRPLQ